MVIVVTHLHPELHRHTTGTQQAERMNEQMNGQMGLTVRNSIGRIHEPTTLEMDEIMSKFSSNTKILLCFSELRFHLEAQGWLALSQLSVYQTKMGRGGSKRDLSPTSFQLFFHLLNKHAYSMPSTSRYRNAQLPMQPSQTNENGAMISKNSVWLNGSWNGLTRGDLFSLWVFRVTPELVSKKELSIFTDFTMTRSS